MKKRSAGKRQSRKAKAVAAAAPVSAAPPQIVHAIQVYDSEKLGFPLAVFEGTGQFQDIARGDTMDGRCWGAIHGHSNYARIYRVVSIRHTLTTSASGQVTHLKSLFVEPVVPPRPATISPGHEESA
jgi:hypothetical protein